MHNVPDFSDACNLAGLAAGIADFLYRGFLELSQHAGLRLYLERHEMPVDAADYVGYACYAVHSAVHFKKPATRHGFQVFGYLVYDVFFEHCFIFRLYIGFYIDFAVQKFNKH